MGLLLGKRVSGSRRPDYDWITPTLAVGGRLPLLGVSRWSARERIRAVIDLRQEACDDVGVLIGNGVQFLHLPTADQAALGQDDLDAGVAFAQRWIAQAAAVLVHCERGIGRSATLALCILADGGMDPRQALLHMKARRACIAPSPAQFESWALWLRRRGKEPPTYQEFRAIAYREGRHRAARPGSGAGLESTA